jgi:uncharacterized membrane protein (DUF485 family)
MLEQRDDAGAASEEVDWGAVERSPEFRELVSRRRRFVWPALAITTGLFTVYLLLAAFAVDFMSTLVAGMPVHFLLSLAMIAMTWITTWLYMRVADSKLEPLERRAAEGGR